MDTADRLARMEASRLASIYAAGTICLGLVGISFQDFALQWQPVSAHLSEREALAVLFGAMLVCGGLGMLTVRIVVIAALAAALTDSTWVLGLMLPKVVSLPGSVAAWLGLAEITSITAAAWMIWAVATRRPTVAHAARISFGLCALIFGISHFAYPDFTASMVPSWLPQPLLWAYATGFGHALAGLALISGVLVRPAALAMTAMCGSFVLLLHVPRVLASPGSHVEWTMLCMALSITGAAWTMRSGLGVTYNLLHAVTGASRQSARQV